MKHRYTTEFEFRATPKVLYPYISTPSGLEQWFAEKVTLTSDQTYHFYWDGEDHPAKLIGSRINKQIHFEFVSNDEFKSSVDFKLETSDLTNRTYLKITDLSANTNEKDLSETWEELVGNLHDIVGR